MAKHSLKILGCLAMFHIIHERVQTLETEVSKFLHKSNLLKNSLLIKFSKLNLRIRVKLCLEVCGRYFSHFLRISPTTFFLIVDEISRKISSIT